MASNRHGPVTTATDYAGYYVRDAIVEIEEALLTTKEPAVLAKLDQCRRALEAVLNDLDGLSGGT